MIHLVDEKGNLGEITLSRGVDHEGEETITMLRKHEFGSEVIHLTKPMAMALRDYLPPHEEEHPGGGSDCHEKCRVWRAKR